MGMSILTLSFLLVGGAVGVFFVYIILETLIFKRIFDDPVKGKMSAVAAAWFVLSLLYGYGTDAERGFDGFGFVGYLPGAMLVAIYAYRRGMRIKQRDQNTVEATFE